MEKAAAAPTGADVSTGENAPDLTGKALGDFHILRLIGKGGMGQVYLAEQTSLKRKVALKIMKPDLAANATSLQRFRVEAEAAARLTHANIVQIYAIGSSDGLHYMALEYVEGRTLREYLAMKGTPEVLLGLSIMRQVAAALQRASEAGIVHRDIKPENILITRKAEVKVTDFGLSRCFAPDQQPVNITQSGVTMGTPLYMSPEQVQGKEVDPRSDLYSFGVTCYHMFAGEPPYRGNTGYEVAIQHVQNEATPLGDIRPDLPPELVAIIHRLMAKDPKDRYQTGRELLKDLTRLRESLAGQSTQGVSLEGPLRAVPTPISGAPTLSASTVVPARSSRPLRTAFGILGVLAALAGGLTLRWWQDRPAGPPSAIQEAEGPVVPSERERFLVQAVQQPVEPGDPRQLRTALDFRIELGLLYLDQHRLNEAERFFTDLAGEGPQIKRFGELARLGQAMTLAFQNRTRQSNDLFLELLREQVLLTRVERDKQPGALGPRFFNNHPQLREMIARAVEHNHQLDPSHFPRELQPLAKIPVSTPAPPRKVDKPTAKEES